MHSRCSTTDENHLLDATRYCPNGRDRRRDQKQESAEDELGLSRWPDYKYHTRYLVAFLNAWLGRARCVDATDVLVGYKKNMPQEYQTSGVLGGRP